MKMYQGVYQLDTKRNKQGEHQGVTEEDEPAECTTHNLREEKE